MLFDQKRFENLVGTAGLKDMIVVGWFFLVLHVDRVTDVSTIETDERFISNFAALGIAHQVPG